MQICATASVTELGAVPLSRQAARLLRSMTSWLHHTGGCTRLSPDLLQAQGWRQPAAEPRVSPACTLVSPLHILRSPLLVAALDAAC